MRYHLYAGADVDKGMPSLGTETGTQEHMQDFMARSKEAYNRVVAELGDAYTVEYFPETF